MHKRIGENHDKDSSEIKKPSAYSNICSYKMKLNKFLGGENEVYDVLWAS